MYKYGHPHCPIHPSKHSSSLSSPPHTPLHSAAAAASEKQTSLSDEDDGRARRSRRNGLPGRGGPGGQLPPGRRDDVGRRPRQGRRRRPRARPHPRQDLRLRVPVQGRVPLRQDRHADQARPRQLRRNCHHLLPVVPGVGARRDRLRVPGQRHGRAVHAAHQRLRAGAGQAGAAVPALVRPHQGIPHLLHRLEPAARHIRGGRHPDPGLQEPRGARGVLPQEPAHAPLRQPLERRRLGHAGRPRQDGLVTRALRRVLPRIQRRRLRHVRRRAAVPGRNHGRLRYRKQLVEPGAQRHELPPHALGAEEVHDLQLLHRPQARSRGTPRRVQDPSQVQVMSLAWPVVWFRFASHHCVNGCTTSMHIAFFHFFL